MLEKCRGDKKYNKKNKQFGKYCFDGLKNITLVGYLIFSI